MPSGSPLRSWLSGLAVVARSPLDHVVRGEHAVVVVVQRRMALAIVAFVRFNFDWMIVCATALGLSVANVVGYTKCSSDAKSKAQLAQVGDGWGVGSHCPGHCGCRRRPYGAV